MGSTTHWDERIGVLGPHLGRLRLKLFADLKLFGFTSNDIDWLRRLSAIQRGDTVDQFLCRLVGICYVSHINQEWGLNISLLKPRQRLMATKEPHLRSLLPVNPNEGGT